MRGMVFREGVARALAVMLLVAAIVGAPAPQFSANEASVATLFPGERIDFTGSYVARPAPHLLRYAITCCRADAQPVALPLARALHARGWARVRGVVIRSGNALVVEAQRVDAVAPPADPFTYR